MIKNNQDTQTDSVSKVSKIKDRLSFYFNVLYAGLYRYSGWPSLNAKIITAIFRYNPDSDLPLYYLLLIHSHWAH